MTQEKKRQLRIKLIEAETTPKLEQAVNTFLEALPVEPIEINYSSGQKLLIDIESGGREVIHPLHIAQIKYYRPAESMNTAPVTDTRGGSKWTW